MDFKGDHPMHIQTRFLVIFLVPFGLSLMSSSAAFAGKEPGACT
jgi:hypothetical protein